MAKIHPSFPLNKPLSAGGYRERDILRTLEEGLPDAFDIFHSLSWSAMHEGEQGFGEYDVVVVSPGGQLLLVEVKAGAVTATDDGLTKDYGRKAPSNVGHQVRRMHSALMERMRQGDLPQVHVGTLLVLPDQRIQGSVVAYPRERIVDAAQMDALCQTVRASFPAQALSEDQRQRVLDFFANRFAVEPDVATHIGQVQQASTQLASGLATWVPRVQHRDKVYVVEATAGSGKTQLALSLLRQAAAAGTQARYVCFNRPLADHLARLAPASCEVTTFHQLCRDHVERQGMVLDFSDAKVFEDMVARYLEEAPGLPARLGLLVLDESQDLNPAWVEALAQSLLPEGRLYVLGDADQQLYEREAFGLEQAVQVRCMDNFRSPRRVVNMINRLGLASDTVVARGAHEGRSPGFHLWEAGKASAMGQLETCLRQLLAEGYRPEQIAVISYRGVAQSEVIRQAQLAGLATRRFTGHYDAAGNPVWSDGDLLVESLYRFKGQSAPAIVLCEVDFEALTDRDRRKLFVGITRAQMRVELVLSARAASVLIDALG